MAGLVRVSVAAGPGSVLDLAVPGQLTVADVLPEIARLGGLPPAGWRLVTATGREVPADGRLSDHGVGDGDVLALVEADATGAVVEDDPAEALAQTVVAEVLPWAPRLLRPVGLGISLLLLVVSGFALSRGPAWSVLVAVAAVVLTFAAATCSSRRHDRLVAAGAGWCAVGLAAVAGGQSAGAPAAGGAAALTALLLWWLLGPMGVLMAPAVVAASALGVLAAVVDVTEVAPGLVATIGLAGAGLAAPSLPRLALAAAPDRPGAARDLLRASLAAAAVVTVVLATQTAASSAAGAVLALVIALLTACRASRHHGAVEVLAGLGTAAGLVVVAGAAVAVQQPAWAGFVGVATLVLAGVAAAGACGLQVVDPRWSVALDRLELVLLLAVVPLVVLGSGAVRLVSGLVDG